jgi:hypothetical protein
MSPQRPAKIEVRREAFTTKDLLALVENLHVQKQLRKYQAQYNYVCVGRTAQIEGVVRSKRSLTPQEVHDSLEGFPRVAYFRAQAGLSLDAVLIEQKLIACANALQNPILSESAGGIYLKVDGKWVPSLGTQLLHEPKN